MGTLTPDETLFSIAGPDDTITVGYGSTLTLASSTLDISTDQGSGTISIETPNPARDIQFSSVTDARLQSGAAGQREGFCAVGIGHNLINSVSDPITLTAPPFSVKLLTGGTITEVHVSLSLVVAATDVTSTVYAQLYATERFDYSQFHPIPGTFMEIPIPYFSPAGTLFTESVTGLSEIVEPGAQLVLGFYNVSTATAGIVAYLGGVAKIV